MKALLLLLLPVLVQAQTLSEPLRQTSPEFVSFYFRRVDRWFGENVHDFKKNLSPKEKALFDDLLSAQKSLVWKTPRGVFRGMTYGVRFDLKDRLETTVTLVDFSGALRERVLEAARAHGVKNPPGATKAYGLRWSSLKPPELVSFDGEKFTFTDAAGLVETRHPLKDSEKEARDAGCPGTFKEGSVEASVLKDGARRLIVSTDQVESEAYGPAGQGLIQKFRHGLNLTPGQVRCTSPSDTEFYYP